MEGEAAKILVIGRDPKILDTNSESFQRVRDYADLFGELHIILMMPGVYPVRSQTTESSAESLIRTSTGVYEHRSFENKLFLWPTNSRFLWLAPYDAWRLGVKLIERYKINLVDAQDASESALAAFLISRRFKLPFRVQVHTDIMSPWYRRSSAKEFMRYCLARFLIPRADCIRAVSQRIKRSILSSFPAIKDKNIDVLPIYTNLGSYIAAEIDTKSAGRFSAYNFKAVSAGRLVEKEKNFSMLIKMMRDFINVAPKSLLVIVGEGPDKENYKLQITNYKLQNNVIIEPWREDLFSLYKSFDLFLFSSNYEGWGRVVIEAMAAGLPVVMTDVGLAGEIIKDKENGLIIPVRDRQAFLEAVVSLYENPGLRNKIKQGARATIEKLRMRSKDDYLHAYKNSLLSCGK